MNLQQSKLCLLSQVKKKLNYLAKGPVKGKVIILKLVNKLISKG